MAARASLRAALSGLLSEESAQLADDRFRHLSDPRWHDSYGDVALARVSDRVA